MKNVFKRNTRLSIFIITGIIVVFSFLKVFTQSNDQNSMSINDFKDKLKSDTSLVVLDVRTPAELTGDLGKIAKAVNRCRNWNHEFPN